MRTFSGFQAALLTAGGLLAMISGGRASAEESSHSILTPLSSTTVSGFVDSSAQLNVASTTPEIPEPSSSALLGMGAVGLSLWYRSRRKRLG